MSGRHCLVGHAPGPVHRQEDHLHAWPGHLSRCPDRPRGSIELSLQAKGACGPATCPVGSTDTGSWSPTGAGGWWPDNASYRCTYAQRFVSVASAYRLGLPQADNDVLRSTLTDCLSGGDGTESLPEQATRAVKKMGSTIWRNPAYSAVAALGALVLGWGLISRGRARGRGPRRRQSGFRTRR